MTTAKTTSKPVKAKPERSSGKESFKADSALAGAEEERSARDKAKKSKKRMEPKVGTLPESDAPLREYPSMSALSGATGIPLDVIKAATWIGWDGKTSCPSFHGLKDPIMAIAKVGKKTAGRMLDGRTHDEVPKV